MNRAPISFLNFVRRGTLHRGAVFAAILLVALLAFEVFNYSTTQFALNDLLGGDLRFVGIPWATILAIAFCGIDFAGIARLFTPQQDRGEATEVWYLFGAWLLAAAMNAGLTWWGVAVAVRSHRELASLVISQQTLANVVPVFVALMVWLIRVLIIGTFSMSGDRMFSMADERPSMLISAMRPPLATEASRSSNLPRPVRQAPTPVAPRPAPRPEPSYHPVGLAAKSRDEAEMTRR
jgi:hypothetical protein